MSQYIVGECPIRVPFYCPSEIRVIGPGTMKYDQLLFLFLKSGVNVKESRLVKLVNWQISVLHFFKGE